jgi:hypothetical protein
VGSRTPSGHLSNGHGILPILLRIPMKTAVTLIVSWNGSPRKLLVYPNRGPSTRTSSRNCYWELVSTSETISLHALQIMRKLLSLPILPTARWPQMMLTPLAGCYSCFLMLSTMALGTFSVKLSHTNTNKGKSEEPGSPSKKLSKKAPKSPKKV